MAPRRFGSGRPTHNRAEGNITVRGSVFAVNHRAETVTICTERREEALDIPVLNVLREGDDSGASVVPDPSLGLLTLSMNPLASPSVPGH
jgi:hypothetical protein